MNRSVSEFGFKLIFFLLQWMTVDDLTMTLNDLRMTKNDLNMSEDNIKMTLNGCFILFTNPSARAGYDTRSNF